MPLQVRFTLGPASGAPAEAAAPSLAFDDERTLLHSLQQLREANQARASLAQRLEKVGSRQRPQLASQPASHGL